MINLSSVVHKMNETATIPETSDFRDGVDASGFWYETRRDDNGNEIIAVIEQVVGGSGVYLVEYDYLTNQVLHDGRPWQMRA